METAVTEIVESKNALSTNGTEAENILGAAQEDAGFEKILKFRKGDYLIGDELIPLGTEFLVHAVAWTKSWIKFADGKIVDRKLYRVARGEQPPQREELDGLDQATWPAGLDGRPADPWVFQYLLPFENMSSGDIVVFATSSVGGRQAISDLCKSYARRKIKGRRGQPIVRLASAEMPTKNFGKVPRPAFEIIRWDDTASDSPEGSPSTTSEVPAILVQPIPPTGKAAAASADMDDEIPF